MNITKHEETKCKRHLDNMKVMPNIQEEMKTTKDLIAKIHDEKCEFSGTKGLFVALQSHRGEQSSMRS